MSSICIEDANVSYAWARAVRPLLGGGPQERGPVVVSITGFKDSQPSEDIALRAALDGVLPHGAKCDTVANTIFPHSLWNPARPRSALFDRYKALLDRLHAESGNKHGLYFERMVTGGRPGHENQLDDVLTSYTSRKGVRRSALQVGIFNAARDQIGSGPRGFPCLQQISFAPLKTGLSVNAFYAAQYAIGRAYGNYLGLCRLGRFIAHELGTKLERVTIFAGILQRDVPVGRLTALTSTIAQQLPRRQP